MPPVTIPQFLLPRGAPSTRSFLSLARTQSKAPTPSASRRCASSSSRSSSKDDKPRVLEKPDKFRPPSHPARRVMQTRNGRIVNPNPVNYGPRLSEAEKQAQKEKQYPNMFPPEGTVMHRFLTNRWIHIWIAMGVLTSLATFTFTETFKRRSPFAHLLPSWSGLVWHPIDTISQALSVYRMDVQHNSLETRQKRQRRVEDAEKRRQYRVAHGMEEPSAEDKEGGSAAEGDAELVGVDEQSPVAVEEQAKEFVDWEGRRRPVKKWLGIW
ncbi:hypothetical protein P170DRAFT_400033 [Aspergillus steynii IBT 23096]|uniref:Uncharacterized protein n=1 Tax=Aspergillus steynii IBT 23096 TaxID=1392250 RepID=A0A2I2GS55_9EURO|nr:uncharacterized protein P170DRAFT_400033 [Aspergillus steynii IBT 23096]PLB55700.1 hypothetical protein P170DRAFT_400033 [Aspergillus steynii IBT 23096]